MLSMMMVLMYSRWRLHGREALLLHPCPGVELRLEGEAGGAHVHRAEHRHPSLVTASFGQAGVEVPGLLEHVAGLVPGVGGEAGGAAPVVAWGAVPWGD